MTTGLRMNWSLPVSFTCTEAAALKSSVMVLVVAAVTWNRIGTSTLF